MFLYKRSEWYQNIIRMRYIFIYEIIIYTSINYHSIVVYIFIYIKIYIRLILTYYKGFSNDISDISLEKVYILFNEYAQ